MQLRFSILFSVLVLAAPVSRAGSGASQEPLPRFRTGVNVVQVDARVVDDVGKAVRGLTASNFTILEDGQPRPLVAFSEVVLPEAGEPATPWLREVAPDVAGNQRPEGRLLVLVMDDAMLPPDAGMVASSKRIAREAVERMGSADRMAVVFTRDHRYAQDFTADRALLHQAIDRTSIGFMFAGRFKTTRHFWQGSFSTLENVATALSTIPARRKAIIYVSIGLPFPLAGSTLLKHWRDISQAGLASNTPIYAFDPSGVGGLESFFATRPMLTNPGGLRFFREFLEDVSANTGGRASLLTNDDHGPRLARLFQDTASYYWLGYESPFPADGRFRRLTIKTNTPGATVLARDGQFARLARRADRPAGHGPADLAIEAAIPREELAMQATAAPFAQPSGEDAKVAVVVGFKHPIAGEASEHEVALVVAAFAPGDHRQKALQRQTAKIRLRRTSSGNAEYEIPTSIDVKPGRYRLRIGAHNRRIDQSGSVFVDVDVPDFRKERVSLSGVVLTAPSGPSTPARSDLRALIPIVPSTLRDFRRGDRVMVFLRVYQGMTPTTEPITMSVRVTDANGGLAHQRTESIGAERFALSRAADFAFTLETHELSEGEYRLDIEATASKVEPQRRQIRFRVR